MRVIVIFLFALCSLLVRSCDTAYAGAQYDRINYSQFLYSGKKVKVNFTHVAHGLTLKKDTSLSEEKEYFISIEGEDGDFVFARKYVSLANHLTTPSYSLSLIYSCSFKDLPFCKHLSHTFSCKYITQRVLRI